jgi:hypothetical protein
MTHLSLALLGLLAVGCGSSGDETDPPSNTSTSALDCSWIQSANCWRAALAELSQCVPQTDPGGSVTTGTLDASRQTCSYDASLSVTFDQPLLPFAPDPLGASVTKDGSECFRLDRRESEGTLHLETSLGSVDVEATASSSGYGAALTCPDGSRYSTDDFIGTMQSCEPDPSDWPATTVEQNAPSLVGIDLGGGPGQVIVFACSY